MLWRLLLGVVAALVGALVCGFAGWLYAGNYATGFVFLGQVGYEAGASSGALGGLVLGRLAGFFLRGLGRRQ
jgi:hypothetical protein